MFRRLLYLHLLLLLFADVCLGQSLGENYILVDGCFFSGMPPGITWDNTVGVATIKDEEGNEATEIYLRKNVSLSEEQLKYQTPVEQVPGGEKLLEMSRSGTTKRFPVFTHNTVTLSKWVGKPFPDFKVTDTMGQVWSKKSLLGKPFVLNYWHTGCGPCIREMPELNKWMETCPDVSYLATTWNTPGQIKKIVETRPFLFRQIADTLLFFNLFKIQVTPTTILVDKKGIIRYWTEGYGKAKLEYLSDKLKQLAVE